jgi:hypothetical protein
MVLDVVDTPFGLNRVGTGVLDGPDSLAIWGAGGGRSPKGNFLKEVSLWTPFKNFQ